MKKSEEVRLRTSRCVGARQSDGKVRSERYAATVGLFQQPRQECGDVAHGTRGGQAPAGGGAMRHCHPPLARVDTPVGMDDEHGWIRFAQCDDPLRFQRAMGAIEQATEEARRFRGLGGLHSL